MSRVTIVKNDEEFATQMALSLANNSKVVIDFNATWCGPCKAIAPLFVQLSQRYPTVTFLSVDVDKCKETATALKISSIPTFQFSMGKTLVKSQVGASKEKLEQNVKLLAESTLEQLEKHVLDSGDVVEGEQEKMGEQDLSESGIDLKRSEALNDTPEHPFADVLKADATYCQSDTDAQLLVTLGFKRVSSIKTLKLVAPDDGSGPKVVKLYLNRANMSFSDIDELKATQSFVLKPEDLKADSPALALDYQRFMKCDLLTIFIECNQSGGETTKLSRLVLWGKKAV